MVSNKGQSKVDQTKAEMVKLREPRLGARQRSMRLKASCAELS